MQYRNLTDLHKLKGNPRTIKEKDFEKLKESIKNNPDYFEARPIVLSNRTGQLVIISGNQRYEVAKSLKLKEVPTHLIENLTEEREREVIIRDNVNNGSFDWDTLLSEWNTEKLDDWGVDVPDDFQKKPEIIEDEAPDAPEEPKSKLGDLWILGDQRLLCGDATKKEDVERLMNGEKADMVFTDPPYGISHSGKGIDGVTHKQDFGEIIGDENIDIAMKAFLFSKKLAQKQIWWGANYYPQILENGFGWIIWDKEREGEIFSGAELAYTNYGIKINIFRHCWHGMIKASEQNEKRIHPTQKPIALVSWCFDNYGNPNTIIDLFGGSGSTLMACEQTNRRCYMLEIAPKYIDVILTRWANYTDKDPIREDGVKWSEIKV